MTVTDRTKLRASSASAASGRLQNFHPGRRLTSRFCTVTINGVVPIIVQSGEGDRRLIARNIRAGRDLTGA